MRIKYLLLTCALVMSSVAVTRAQERVVTRKFGLTASLQGGQAAVMVPLWLSDTVILAPGLAIDYVEKVRSDFGLFLAQRFYINMDRIAPYIAAQAGVGFNRPDAGTATEDLTLGAGFGGEYFLNPPFSFGIEAQLNGFIVDLSGIARIALSTATANHANVYF